MAFALVSAGWFETKPALQLVLLITVMVAACMVMSDGVLTPAISVISAIEGIQYNAGIPKGKGSPAACRQAIASQE